MKNFGGAANNDDFGFLRYHGMTFMHLVQNNFRYSNILLMYLDNYFR